MSDTYGFIGSGGVTANIAPPVPLSVRGEGGKEILRLERDGTLHIDPANTTEAAFILVSEVKRLCQNIGYPFSTLPAAVEAGERAQIVAWLREDAGKTREDLSRLHAARKLTIAQTAEWENLITLKGGLADAIKRGEHLAAKGKDQADG